MLKTLQPFSKPSDVQKRCDIHCIERGRNRVLKSLLAAGIALCTLLFFGSASRAVSADSVEGTRKVEEAVTRGLDFLAREQRRQGYWEVGGGNYRIAMTALSGVALVSEGSTTTRGKYARNISRAVDYLLDASQPNGLIGFPDDYHYTYGHGFSMLFLSQVYGEEEDVERRKNIRRVLENAVKFSAAAQTSKGGWGYVSAKDGNDFDEGSTCITQVQALRACRNAGIVVPGEIIERARKYIYDCTNPMTGGVYYSIQNQGGDRPPITAAAVAVLFNTGDSEQSKEVKKMMEFCEGNVWPNGQQDYGHWHYMHYYYAQVMYRQPQKWEKYSRWIEGEILSKQTPQGSWEDNSVGAVYVTAMNTTILQLNKGYLPIYQR